MHIVGTEKFCWLAFLFFDLNNLGAWFWAQMYGIQPELCALHPVIDLTPTV